MSLRGRRHGGGRKNELVFLTTCGPATTFDPKITGVDGVWFFDDGTTLAAASGVEISKTFASGGLHWAKFYPGVGGLVAITRIDADTDLISSITNIEKTRVNRISLYSNASMAFNVDKIPYCTFMTFAVCGASVICNISALNRASTWVELPGNSVYGSLSDLPSTVQSAFLYSTKGYIIADSIAHLVNIRDIRIYSMGWLTADVDLVLLSIANAIVADAAHFTYATPVINIGGTNEAPSGIYQAPTGPGGTPTSGLEAVWIMAHNTDHAWVATFTGGVANELLLGNVAGTGEKSWADIGALNTRTYAQRFVATSGSLSDLKIKVSGNTNMKMAVYTDVAGDPGTLLAASDEFSAVSGWNKVTLNTVCDLATGSYYWITFKPSVSSVVYYNATGGAMSYKDTTYADAFTADFGAHSDTTVDLAVGGYGLKVV